MEDCRVDNPSGSGPCFNVRHRPKPVVRPLAGIALSQQNREPFRADEAGLIGGPWSELLDYFSSEQTSLLYLSELQRLAPHVSEVNAMLAAWGR